MIKNKHNLKHFEGHVLRSRKVKPGIFIHNNIYSVNNYDTMTLSHELMT